MSGARRPATLRTVLGLPSASLVVMAGVVWAANPGRWGTLGIVAGTALVVAGGLAAFRFFRRDVQP